MAERDFTTAPTLTGTSPASIDPATITPEMGADLAAMGAPPIDSPEFMVWLSQKLGLEPAVLAKLMQENPEAIAARLDEMGQPPPEDNSSIEKWLRPDGEVPPLEPLGKDLNPAPAPTMPEVQAPPPGPPPGGYAIPPQSSLPSPSSPAGGARAASELQTPVAASPAPAAAATTTPDIGKLLTALEGVQAPVTPEVPSVGSPPSHRAGDIRSGGLADLILSRPGQQGLEDNRIRLSQALRR